MTPEDIHLTLLEKFGEVVTQVEPTVWQVETSDFRLLVLLSEDQSWLRILIPIAPVKTAKILLEKLLEANFDQTQQTRYAIYQDVVWGVFQHNRESLSLADFSDAIALLISLYEKGLSEFFKDAIEDKILQVIKAAKLQGQSMEATLQTLERFYAEGLMGELEGTSEEREKTLAAWRQQLERLWSEVE